MGSDEKKSIETPIAVRKLGRWVRSRSVREKLTLGAVVALVSLLLLKLFVKNRAYFYVAAQASHAVGVLILVYKLTVSKTCAGLSLKSQELTAIHLALGSLASSIGFRSFVFVGLDVLALVVTLWVIYMMRFKLKSTYVKDLDTTPLSYILLPCAVVSLIAHPRGYLNFFVSWIWAFCMTVEAVAVLPQLRLMQNAKIVEPFTANYVFALGMERYFGCANWIIQVILNPVSSMIVPFVLVFRISLGHNELSIDYEMVSFFVFEVFNGGISNQCRILMCDMTLLGSETSLSD